MTEKKCSVCGILKPAEAFHVVRKTGSLRPACRDHFVPVSKGGHHTKENIIPACGICNCEKYVKILDAKPMPLGVA